MKISGKPNYVSREFIRSWVSASACILSHHGYFINLKTLDVKVCDLSKVELDVEDTVGAGGMAHPGLNLICLEKENGKQGMASTILHEMIHLGAYGLNPEGFGANTDEKCTSTLTARLKPQVARLAQVLIDGTYKRAAYFAHTKLSYRTEEDHYDKSQKRPVRTRDKYRENREHRECNKIIERIFEGE